MSNQKDSAAFEILGAIFFVSMVFSILAPLLTKLGGV